MGMTSKNVFAEFEEYEASIADVDIRMTLFGQQRRRWEHTYVQAGELHVQGATLGGGYIAEGSICQTGWAFYLNLSRIPELANGVELSNNDVFVMPPGSEYSFSSLEAQDWIGVVIPSKALLPLPEMEAFVERAFAHVVAPACAVTRRLSFMLRRFSASAILEPGVADEEACVKSFAEETIHLARQIIGVAETVAPDARLMKRHALCKRAMELIENCPDMDLTIGEVATTLDVSVRGLQLAFAKHYGISPQQYLNQRRLARARQVLLHAEPGETTVRATAAKVGLWDFGRFAANYRGLFDELPSETLARQRRLM